VTLEDRLSICQAVFIEETEFVLVGKRHRLISFVILYSYTLRHAEAIGSPVFDGKVSPAVARCVLAGGSFTAAISWGVSRQLPKNQAIGGRAVRIN
jgi:hypothetical protein